MRKANSLKGNFHLLLFFMGLLLVAGPFLRPDRVGRIFLNLLIGAFLAAGVFAFIRKRRVLVMGIVLALASLLTTSAALIAPGREIAIARQSLLAVYTVFTAAVLLSAVLAAGRITPDKLSGAVCIFLLLGITWASVFSVMELVTPGSIEFPEEEAASVAESLQRGEPSMSLIYFSFVTLTTLGYGDIVPVSRTARTLAWTEAVVGQLYLAILVARLVGMQLTHTGSGKDD